MTSGDHPVDGIISGGGGGCGSGFVQFNGDTFNGAGHLAYTTSSSSLAPQIEEKTKAEIMNGRAELAMRLRPFVSERWLLMNVFDFTEEEAQQLDYERRAEATKQNAIGHDLEPLVKTEMGVVGCTTSHEDPDVSALANFKVNVGPNDILLVYYDVTYVPPNRVEGVMKRAKDILAPVFAERGLKGRSLFIPMIDKGPTRFDVIGIEDVEKKLIMRYNPFSDEEDISLPVRRDAQIRTKPKFPPPVMG
jgi:hypothetical protein